MEKIILTVIFAAMLLTACGNTSDNMPENTTETTTEITVETTTESTTERSVEELLQLQIDPAEEFDGITFGMTKDEVIEFIGKQPDDIVKKNAGTVLAINYIEYHDETHFNVSNAKTQYHFNENDILCRIDFEYNYNNYSYTYPEELLNDYKTIKEEFLKRYPEEICSYFHDKEIELYLNTPNRSVTLFADTDFAFIGILIEIYEEL